MSDQLDVVRYLDGKGYTAKKASGPEVVYPCFFDCGEHPSSRKRKLYVNTVEVLYDCKVCGERGNARTLLKHFGDAQDIELSRGPNHAERTRLLTEAAEVAADWLTRSDEHLLYLLNERGLTPETIVERQLGLVSGRWSLTGCLTDASHEDLLDTGLVYREGQRAGRDFFYDHLMIPYVANGQVVQLRGKSLRWGNYMTGPGESVRLYNTDSLRAADEVIITEGEFDCIALSQALARGNARAQRFAVVAVPGADAIGEGFASYFDDARRIYIAFDPDEPGRKGAARAKELLGARARIVSLPEGEPKVDWTELFVSGGDWHDAMDLIAQASGRRLATLREAGRRWRELHETVGGLQTGYASLDQVMTPGLLPGQLVVMIAKTGTGKTLVLCNLAYQMREEPTLFISLEMTQAEVYERLQRIYRHHHPRATDAEVERAFTKLLICDENRLSERDLAQLIEEFELEVGERPTNVMVDYLGYYARGMPGGSPYEKTSNAVMQLKAEAKRHQVVLFTPHQVNRVAKEGKPIDMDDARDSGVVEETADFLWAIWKPDDALRDHEAQPSGKVKVTVLKSRHGGKGTTITLQMDVLTLAIVDDATPEAKEAQRHNHYAWRGHSYADLRAQQTASIQNQLEGTRT